MLIMIALLFADYALLKQNKLIDYNSYFLSSQRFSFQIKYTNTNFQLVEQQQQQQQQNFIYKRKSINYKCRLPEDTADPVANL